MRWHFPEARKFTTTATAFEQLHAIGSEYGELYTALIHAQGDERVIEECWDLIHACETLLRKYDPAIVKQACVDVEAKNRKRGYYGRAIDDSITDGDLPTYPGPGYDEATYGKASDGVRLDALEKRVEVVEKYLREITPHLLTREDTMHR